ncbi:MAG TPA: DNA mismatch repair endonuclease MutL [Bacteroidetes bacterium]|nr:DNA mismatch repair endonuclease MutL [Bacteroidota bacterium]
MTEGKIKVLSESLSNKIAAGEVIDRPSSVVKELVENAIDAEAISITVIVRDGGKSLIQVIDNGSGMIETDAILAFERHSTSKISRVEDLNRIETMGFRGEALASIGSVSRIELKACIAGEVAATSLELEGGIIKNVGKAAGKQGTSLAIKNLFFNTPARRKFLKSDIAEYRHILQVMHRYFLSYPEISFHFFKNDDEIFNLPATGLRQRVIQVYGDRVREHLVEVKFEHANGTVTGLIGDMDLFRRSRGDQFLFLNRRFIQNKSISWSVINAYHTMLPKGSYPFYALFLQVNPEVIDVNVHPSKIEVRFENERAIFGMVYRAVKEALLSNSVIPVLHTDPVRQEFETISMEKPSTRQHTAPERPNKQSSPQKKMAFQFEFRKEKRALGFIPGQNEVDSAPSAAPEPPSGAMLETVSVWQLHNKFIFSQIKSGLIIIDQHLAHERVLYEKALQSFENMRPVAQQQLFPKTVELSPDDFETLLEMQFYLTKLGFVVREFGKFTVIIEAVPAELHLRNEEKVLREMIDDFKESKEPDIRERIAATFSCKSAIKAGDKLKTGEIIALIDNLFATKNPYFCPHGRPIIVTVPMEELDRRFLRT